MTQFAYGPHSRHALDIYRPRQAKDATVIIFYYGGRWQSGQKGMYRLLAWSLTSRGYVVVVPDYRLYPEVRFPSFLEDAAQAVRWTKNNIARFGGDPRSIFLMGHSAGAYIAAMLALDPQWLGDTGIDNCRDLAGFIGLAGPYDFLPLQDSTLIDIFGGANRPETQPITFADRKCPPALLFTGDRDGVVNPRNSSSLEHRLRSGGKFATTIILRRLGHITILAPFVFGLDRWFRAETDVMRFCKQARTARPRQMSEADEAVL